MTNIIISCRILCSLFFLFVLAFSLLFYIVIDMIDGAVARKTNTANE